MEGEKETRVKWRGDCLRGVFLPSAVCRAVSPLRLLSWRPLRARPRRSHLDALIWTFGEVLLPCAARVQWEPKTRAPAAEGTSSSDMLFCAPLSRLSLEERNRRVRFVPLSGGGGRFERKRKKITTARPSLYSPDRLRFPSRIDAQNLECRRHWCQRQNRLSLSVSLSLSLLYLGSHTVTRKISLRSTMLRSVVYLTTIRRWTHGRRTAEIKGE